MAGNVDWTNVKPEVAREILRQGEMHLQGMLQLAIAADQRATTTAGIFLAVVAAVLAVIFTASPSGLLLLAGSVLAASYIIAGALCILASLPIEFGIPGNYPKNWWGDRSQPIEITLGQESENCQEIIEDNFEKLKRNARYFRAGCLAAIIGSSISTAILIMTLY